MTGAFDVRNLERVGNACRRGGKGGDTQSKTQGHYATPAQPPARLQSAARRRHTTATARLSLAAPSRCQRAREDGTSARRPVAQRPRSAATSGRADPGEREPLQSNTGILRPRLVNQAVGDPDPIDPSNRSARA